MPKETLIELKELTVGYQQQPLFEPLTAQFLAGGKYLLLGDNGAGKSTLLHVLSGQYRGASVLSGELSYWQNNQVTHKCPAAADFLRIVSDRQLHQLSLGLANLFVECVVASGETPNFFYQGSIPAELSIKITTIATELNISHFLDKQIKTLSHGQRMLVLLARALIANPRVLILDEVESYLDSNGRQFLQDFFSENSTTVISASHHQGELFQHFQIIPLNNSVTKKSDSQTYTFTDAFDHTKQVNHIAIPLIDIKNGYFYRGLTPILEAINLTLNSATCYWVLGKNGAGKSTLLDAIFGRLYPVQKYNPRIDYYFADEKAAPATIQQQIGYAGSVLAEEIEDGRGYDSLIAWQFIQATIEGVHPLRLSTDTPSLQTQKLAAQCAVTHLLHMPLAKLSSGQRRRLEITRAISVERKILLLDEPFNNLDKTSKAELTKLIAAIVNELGLCVVLTSHEKISGLNCPLETILVKDKTLHFN